MKLPKLTKRFCPKCNAQTEQKIKSISTGAKRGSMKLGGAIRVKLRGLNVGIGNQGRYSKPAVSKHKRKSKTTKKTNIMYTCKACNKSKYQKKGKRTGKLVQE